MLAKIERALPDSDIRAFELNLKTQAPLAKNGERGKAKDKSCSNTTAKEDRGAEYTARRLKRDNPELLEKVSKGDLSLNQAAIKAGFRKQNITIPYDPQEAARTLYRRYKKGEFKSLNDAAFNRRSVRFSGRVKIAAQYRHLELIAIKAL